MKQGLRLALLTCAALLGTAAAPKTIGWSTTATLGEKGDPLLGNPAAEVRLTEFVSYTCAECARYNIESDAVLKLAYVPSGRVAIELRVVADSPVDLAAAMLTRCGAKEQVFLNHNAMLRSQPRWLPMVKHATAAQRFRWNNRDLGARNRAIAADLKFYDVMATRGYDRQTVERCLADQALASRITARSTAIHAEGVTQTPGFAINGKLLENTRNWASLRPKLDESLN